VGNLGKRVEKLEQRFGTPRIIFILRFETPDGPEILTEEEEAALEVALEQFRKDSEPCTKGFPWFDWTRETAQELLAGKK
jgi:hypothetical protein